eukprot:Sdes_comp9059_c0_seq1m497
MGFSKINSKAFFSLFRSLFTFSEVNLKSGSKKGLLMSKPEIEFPISSKGSFQNSLQNDGKFESTMCVRFFNVKTSFPGKRREKKSKDFTTQKGKNYLVSLRVWKLKQSKKKR